MDKRGRCGAVRAGHTVTSPQPRDCAEAVEGYDLEGLRSPQAPDRNEADVWVSQAAAGGEEGAWGCEEVAGED